MFEILLKKFKVLLMDESVEDADKKVIDEQVKPLKDVKLFTEDGTLIESYNGVYLSHRDKNIYHIYTKEDGDLIVRIDKGANMMLTAQDVPRDKIED